MNSSRPIKVLCVDDNRLVADAIVARLRLTGGYEWAGHLLSADELLAAAAREQPDIILLDLDMPGADPLQVARELTETGSTARVIVFSGHVSLELFERAIAAGAWGYVSKSDGEDALVDGIQRVAQGEFALSPEIESLCDSNGRERGGHDTIFTHLFSESPADAPDAAPDEEEIADPSTVPFADEVTHAVPESRRHR